MAAKSLPTIEDLHRLFLCVEDGVLIRKTTQSAKAKAGMIAGNMAGTGYLQVMVLRRPLLVHRVVWAMHNGRWPVEKIDHINGNRVDNRPENLREATHGQNLLNCGARRRNKLGIKGVSETANGTYHVRASANGVKKHFGTFKTIEEAVSVYAKEARNMHGDFFNQGRA